MIDAIIIVAACLSCFKLGMEHAKIQQLFKDNWRKK